VSAPRPRPEILSIAPYVGGESTLSGARRVIKLSSNEGAFGPPPGALAAIANGGAALHRYPDGGSAALREAIGSRFGLDPARIVCGNGSDELIGLLIQGYGGPGTELLMSAHGFAIYEIAGVLAGGSVVKVPERDLIADVDAFLARVTERTRLVFLANPNNPTGSLVPPAEIARLRDGLPPEALLVLDAAYAEYVDLPDYDGGASLVDAGEGTVMTRTFSKIWGLGGVRLGWAYAPHAIADVLNRLRAPFNVNSAAAAAAIAALAEPGWLEMSRAHNSAERSRMEGVLTGLGIRIWPSQGNFLLADFGSEAEALAADAHLRATGIIVRRVASYDLPHCLRITIGTEAENAAVAEALTEFMSETATRG
jgi:histidinol-phosphate aminotransferase